MKKMLSDLLFIFPVMFYFLLEALVVGLIISVIWKIFFTYLICELTYLQIVGGYWILKLVLFDVFKLISGLQQRGENMKTHGESYDVNNNNYNQNELEDGI